MTTEVKIDEGLKGIVVAHSEICAIDGERGTLSYRGIDIGDLAKHSTYEETVYLLWHGKLPTQTELDAFNTRLRLERQINGNLWSIISALPGNPQPMEALRTAVSALSCFDPDVDDYSRDTNMNKAIRLTTRLPIVVAYCYRHLQGQDKVSPDLELSHAANFLYMLRGEKPEPWEARAMDMALILMADHEFNASTFAARVTASTLSDMYSSITTAIGTLKGPLHGGANQRVMEMLLEIKDEAGVEAYIDAALAAKQRIMGFGHRVYRKGADPRSAYLKDKLYEVRTMMGDGALYNLAETVAGTVERKKQLYPNVDFFTAPLLYSLGLPVNLFTPVFAISRIAGWTAHIMEQYEHNHLLRPLSHYTGARDVVYVPIEHRD